MSSRSQLLSSLLCCVRGEDGGWGGGKGRMEGCFSPVDDALKVIQRARLSYHPGAEQVQLRMRVLGYGMGGLGAQLWLLSTWRGEHMGTRIDHGAEQRPGRVSEVSRYSAALLLFDIMIPSPTNLLCLPRYSFWPAGTFIDRRRN